MFNSSTDADEADADDKSEDLPAAAAEEEEESGVVLLADPLQIDDADMPLLPVAMLMYFQLLVRFTDSE